MTSRRAPGRPYSATRTARRFTLPRASKQSVRAAAQPYGKAWRPLLPEQQRDPTDVLAIRGHTRYRSNGGERRCWRHDETARHRTAWGANEFVVNLGVDDVRMFVTASQ